MEPNEEMLALLREIRDLQRRHVERWERLVDESESKAEDVVGAGSPVSVKWQRTVTMVVLIMLGVAVAAVAWAAWAAARGQPLFS